MADDAPSFIPPGFGEFSEFSVVMHYDPLMVAELALGADDPYTIADRYGVSEEDYDRLAALPWFVQLVATKRHEYHDSGVLFTAKAAMMAEALLTRLFQQSMVGSLTPPLVVDVAKQLTDIGRLKPQPLNTLNTPGSGSGFQINIQVNGSDVVAAQSRLVPAPASSTLAGATTGVAVAASLPDTPAAAVMNLDFAPKGTPPASLSNLRVPDFDLRHPGASTLGGAPPPASVGLPSKTGPA